MCRNRSRLSVVGLLFATAACTGVRIQFAQAQDVDTVAPKSTFGQKDTAAPQSKNKGDAVKAAFTLPSNVELNARQQKAFDQLKSENEGPLRDAADRVQDATSPREEAAALNDLKKIRTQIRNGIQQIVSTPNPNLANGNSKGSDYNPSQSEVNPGYGYPAYANPGYAGYWPNYAYPAYYPGTYPGYYAHAYHATNWPNYYGRNGASHGRPTRSTSSKTPTK